MSTGDGRVEHKLFPGRNHPSAASRGKWTITSRDLDGNSVSQVEQASDQGRILFVDNDPVVLGALQRMMQPRSDWSSMAVGNGEAALRELESQPFDIIIADVEMPVMMGSDLLGEVQARYPDVVRIHLSGSIDHSMALRVVPVAHQFLTKPIDIEHLYAVIDQAAALRRLLRSGRLRRLVGTSDELPAAPTAYMALNRCLADPGSTFKDVAEVVSIDTSMCASILKLVNSAFFGSPKPVTNITEAVSFLGIGRIRELVLTLGVIRMFEGAATLPGFSLGYLKRHALLTAIISRHLEVGLNEDDVAMAGMLHELGQLLLASRRPERFKNVLESAKSRPLHEVELEHLGATHAEVGAYLLGLWGFPAPIVEAVALHHEPSRSVNLGMDILAALHISDHLVAEVEGESPLVLHERHGSMDEAFLESLGVVHRLPEWRSMARKLASREVRSSSKPSASPEPNTESSDEESIDTSNQEKLLVVGVMSTVAGFIASCQRALEGAAKVQQVWSDAESLRSIDVLLVPLTLPLRVGLEAFSRLRSENPHLPMILAASGLEQELAKALLQTGADDLVSIPFESTALLETLERLTSEHQHAANALPLPEVEHKEAQPDQEAAARNRRKCFRVRIPPDFAITIAVRIGLTLLPLTAKDLSVVTDGQPGGILLCVDDRTSQRLPLSLWSDGTNIPLRMELPDDEKPLWFEGRIIGEFRSNKDRNLCFAVQYTPQRADTGRIYRYWVEAQRRAGAANS